MRPLEVLRKRLSRASDRQLLEAILERELIIMADLTNLSGALDQLSTDVSAKLDELLADIAALNPGDVITQDQIDALTAKVTAIDTTVTGTEPPAA